MTLPLSRVRLAVPAGYADHSALTFVAPERASGFSANIVVTSDEHLGQSAAQWGRAQLEQLQQDMDDVELLHEGPVTVSGRPGYVVEFTFVTDNGLVLRQRQVMGIAGDRIFTLSMTQLHQTFDAMAAQFDALQASFALDA